MTGTQNIQFVPTADKAQLQQIMDIQRRQQLASQLLDNAKMPNPNDMAGNVVYRHSPLEYLARGASQALGSRENLKAQQMAMELQGQQFNGMFGGGDQSSGAASGVSGYSPKQLLQAKFAESFVPGGGKATLDYYSPTNEAKNAAASGVSNPVALAGAITAAQQGNTYSDRTIGGVQHVPVLNSDAARLAQPLIDSAGGQPPQSMPQSPPMPAPMSFGGPPLPVQQAPLPPPIGQGAMNAPSDFDPRPPPMMPDQGALGPVVPGEPAAGAALTPQPNPIAAVNAVNNAAPSGAVTPPAIGDDPRYASKVAADQAGSTAYSSGLGKSAADYKDSLDSRVAVGFNGLQRQKEMQSALENFRTGATGEQRARLGAYARDLGMPEAVVNGVTGGDPASAQEFSKLAATNSLNNLKQALSGDSSPGGQIRVAEFNVFQKNNPNLATDPQAIQKIFKFSRKLYDQDFEEQQAYSNYTGDPTKWQSEYAKIKHQNLDKPNIDTQPIIKKIGNKNYFQKGDDWFEQ